MAVVTADKLRKVPVPEKPTQFKGGVGADSEQKIAALEAVVMRMIEQSGADKATKDKALVEFVTLKTMDGKNPGKYLQRLMELTSNMKPGDMDGTPGMEDKEDGLLSMAPMQMPAKLPVKPPVKPPVEGMEE